ncbi:hypothetical protein RMB13_07150 [Acinetobacter sp. V102_4]|uniref:hypothetical protein n=1 Tax=Acinetobacter sp. V102_4 TaxID=3072984 RepID=UPI00287C5B66|nr:hypothetical protein [Acinetobacter sp. V102_4]MDS7929254.1 hypothetical protein [Acinetobacter sp. V102_4]
MRSEFEKNRYWIGLYRSDVDFDETLGEFGRYVANGSRRFDAANLESFNEKWEAYANAWQHRQTEVDELNQELHLVLDNWNDLTKAIHARTNGTAVAEARQLYEKVDELQKRVDAAKYYMKNIFSGVAEVDQCHLGDLLDILDGKIVDELEQALKGGHA